jgi:uncharacterized protein (TIGR02453 family)
MATQLIGFTGFPDGGTEFFVELQEAQSREWFAANKERCQRLWARPLEALVGELHDALSETYPEMRDVQPHVFRIQRDVRFSQDKSPYKTHIAAAIPVRPSNGERWRVPAVYVHFGLEGDVLAVGRWMLDTESLARYRAAVVDDRAGPALARILAELTDRGWRVGAHEALKRVPPAYPKDHPRADLLKYKGLAVSLDEIPQELFNAPSLADWIAARLREPAPLVAWLDKHVH